jgi:hypothetical protein
LDDPRRAPEPGQLKTVCISSGFFGSAGGVRGEFNASGFETQANHEPGVFNGRHAIAGLHPANIDFQTGLKAIYAAGLVTAPANPLQAAESATHLP